MSKRVTVVIAEDPTKTHRPVEALRIALGLCAGDHETTVCLLGNAPLLLTDEIDDVVDVDILEKYRPSFRQLDVPFVVESASQTNTFLTGFPSQANPGPIFAHFCNHPTARWSFHEENSLSAEKTR